MKNIYKNEKGFSTIELVLVIIVVVLIGLVGWLVYKNHHKITYTRITPPTSSKESVPSSPTIIKSPNSTTSSTPTSTSYFTITQWGVRASYSSSLKLEYTPDSNPSNQMFVSSDQLNAEGPSTCSTTDGAAGYIGRYLPTDAVPTEGPASQSAQQYTSDGGTSAYAKIGDYYYIYFTGQGNSCNSTNLLTQTQGAFSVLVTKLAAY